MKATTVEKYDGRKRCVVCGHKAIWEVWYSTSHIHYCDKHLPKEAKR